VATVAGLRADDVYRQLTVSVYSLSKFYDEKQGKGANLGYLKEY